MSRLSSMVLISLLISMLFGCGPVYKREYQYTAPRSDTGKMCASQCIQNKSMCEQMCQMNADNCRAQAHHDAIYEFQVYANEQHAKGAPVEKNVNDFDRGYRCGTPCQCMQPYNACYSACGGQVLERQVCVAFCNKS